MTDRYRNYPDRLDLAICSDCSSRELLYLIDREEIPAHDAWHDAADLDETPLVRPEPEEEE